MISRRSSAPLAALLLAAVIAPVPTLAQAAQCRIPDALPQPEREDPPPGAIRNIRATHYLLALSWSPHFCQRRGGEPKNRFQCSGEAGQFGFILHGLWPDVAGKRDPAWCGPAAPLSKALIREHFCMTPSPDLLQHEWAKHGSCASTDPARYFKAASLLYRALTFPDMDMLSRRRITAATIAAAFAARNPGLTPNSVAVFTDDKGWLKEVRLCLTQALRPMPCRPEDRGVAATRFVKVWRGGRP